MTLRRWLWPGDQSAAGSADRVPFPSRRTRLQSPHPPRHVPAGWQPPLLLGFMVRLILGHF